MSVLLKKNESAGFVEVINKPSEAELKEYYQNKYYQEEKASYAHEYSESEILFKTNKIKVKSHVVESLLNNKASASMLDVGCGEGFVIDYFQKKNWEVAGLDFSSFGCESQNPSVAHLIDVGDIYENIGKHITSGKQYDVIWLDNVLEHVTDVSGLLQKCKQLCAPSGVLTITVPNDFSQLQASLLSEGMIDQEFWVAIPDHLSYFTAPSLRECLDQHGWNTEKIIADFPIDWFLTNAASNYMQDRSKGKSAHHSRVWLHNHMVANNSMDKVVDYYESLANLGMGRNITGFFRLKQ